MEKMDKNRPKTKGDEVDFTFLFYRKFPPMMKKVQYLLENAHNWHFMSYISWQILSTTYLLHLLRRMMFIRRDIWVNSTQNVVGAGAIRVFCLVSVKNLPHERYRKKRNFSSRSIWAETVRFCAFRSVLSTYTYMRVCVWPKARPGGLAIITTWKFEM